MRENKLGVGKGEVTFKINITFRNFFIGILLWLYLISINGSKGYFFSDEGVLGIIGTGADIIIGFVAGIPLLFIDLMPVILTTVLIIFHFLDKPIKKLFLSSLLFLLITHFFYYGLSSIGFVRSGSLNFAGFILFILTLFFLFSNETNRTASKVIIKREWLVKLEMYNLLMGGFLIFLVVMVLFTPFIGLSNEADAVVDFIGAAGSMDQRFVETTGLITETVDYGVNLINLPTILLKIPFLVISIFTLIKLYKNKEEIFTIPLAVIIIGILTFNGVPLVLERLKMDELFSVSGTVKMLGYLLMAWVIFEMVFVKELGNMIKTVGVTRAGEFADLLKESRFSPTRIMNSVSKIPFIGKKVDKQVGKPKMAASNIVTNKKHEHVMVETESKVAEMKSGYLIESPFLMIKGWQLYENSAKDGLKLKVIMEHLNKIAISAIVLDVNIKDILGNQLDVYKGVQVLDLNLKKGVMSEWINVPVPISHLNARNLEITVTNVVFEEGTIGTYSSENIFRQMPPLNPLTRDVSIQSIKQIFFESKGVLNVPMMHFEPVDVAEGWICSCGTFNNLLDEHCLCCSNDKLLIYENCQSAVLEAYYSSHLSEIESMKVEKKAERNRVISSTLEKTKGFILKCAEFIWSTSKVVFEKVKVFSKSNPKTVKIALASVIILLIVLGSWGFITSRPLTEERAISIYFKHMEASNPESVEFIFDRDQLRIGFADKFETYEIYKSSEVEFDKNFFGLWQVKEEVRLGESVKPLYTPNFSEDKALFSTYLSETLEEKEADIVLTIPEVSDYSKETNLFKIPFIIENNRGKLSGELQVRYDFDELNWIFKEASFDKNRVGFVASDSIKKAIKDQTFMQNINAEDFTVNQKTYLVDEMKITPNGLIESSWDYKQIYVPVLLEINSQTEFGKHLNEIRFDYDSEFGYVLSETSKNLMFSVESAKWVGKLNLNHFIGHNDFAVADVFKTESSHKDVIVGVRGTLEPQRFDGYGDIIGYSRQLAEIVVFDADGNEVSKNPKFMLSDIHSNFGDLKAIDIMYNDYEMGVNVLQTHEIFKYYDSSKPYLILKDIYESGGEARYTIVQYGFSDSYEFVELNRLSGYTITEGGILVESMAYQNGEEIAFETLYNSFWNTKPNENDFYVVSESQPDSGGSSWIKLPNASPELSVIK